jgi:hypothetical protein
MEELELGPNGGLVSDFLRILLLAPSIEVQQQSILALELVCFSRKT